MGKKQKDQQAQPEFYEAFLSGIPYECNEKDIQEFLGSMEGVIGIKMSKFQDTGRCRGTAHVKFNSEDSYQKALEKSGKELGTRYITISPAKGQKQQQRAPKIPVGCRVLFVKGLPYETTEKELKEQFSSCGVLTDVRMVRNWANKNFKGFAYFDYRDLGSVKKAINKYHLKFFKGRKLRCDGVSTIAKKGFKKRDPEGYGHQQQEE